MSIDSIKPDAFFILKFELFYVNLSHASEVIVENVTGVRTCSHSAVVFSFRSKNMIKLYGQYIYTKSKVIYYINVANVS